MRLYRSTLTMPGADMPKENPLPRFRDRVRHQDIASDGTLTGEELAGLGRHTGFRVLPYCMQDDYTQEKTDRTYEALILENQRLRATILPALGGRLWSLFDKIQNRELLFRNPVLQPANLAIRDAWFSGGIEWNMGQVGHTYTTCDHVHCARVQGETGEEFLRIYDYVRTTGLLWQVDLHLPDGAACLYAHVQVINDQAFTVPLYWWTNIAVPERPDLRIFSGTKDVIYIKPNTLTKEGSVHAYGHAQLPGLPTMPGVDATYPFRSQYTNEYFFQNGVDGCPWEAAAYDDGFAFVERSTQPLRIRKMFCWGHHPGGRNWLDHLSVPGQGNYVEIQAGLAPTQVHGLDLEAGGVISFTQAFGSMTMGPGTAHVPDWETAKTTVEAAAEAAIPAADLEQLHHAFSRDAQVPCGALLHLGRGWAALEAERRADAGEPAFPSALTFPREAMGPEERMWSGLLHGQALPPLATGQLPQSWMVDSRWEPYLTAAQAQDPENNAIPVFLGVLRYENGREEQAAGQWQAAGDQAAALRNLAVYHDRRGQLPQAIACLSRAFALTQCLPLAREYLDLLARAGEFARLWQVYQTLDSATARDERIMISAASAAQELGQEDFLEMAFAHPYAVIREGETKMTDLWFRHAAAKEAARTGRTDLSAVEQALRTAVHPPRNIDYRLTQK